MRGFLSELHRRNVYKVGAAYAVGGWILIEVTSVLLPAFGAPVWVFRVFALLVVLGGPLALVLAWAFELTPEGLKRSDEVPRDESIAPRTGRYLDFAIIGLLVIALGVSVSLNLRDTGGGHDASVAVLPFVSLSPIPEHVMFADGMHDELLSRLGSIGSLKVISRTSVMQYRDSPKSVRQIGDELGVSTVLEGSVRRAGDKVRISVQLIDTDTDEHLWANTYDWQLSTDNTFAIQAEIASTITETLKAELTPDEKQRLAKSPTGNLEAYNLYLAGRQNLYLRELENLQRARELFEEAITLDPGFAKAYAGLSDALLLLSLDHFALPVDEAVARSETALDKALSLEREDADIYASLILLKSGEEADDAFDRAMTLNPNHAEAIARYAEVAVRRGDQAEAIKLYERSLELDPLARRTQIRLGESYAAIGEHRSALDRFLETGRLNPDWAGAPSEISDHLAHLGRLDEALVWFHKARGLSGDLYLNADGIQAYVGLGLIDRAVALYNEIPHDHPAWVLAQAQARRFQGDLSGALAMLDGALAKIERPGARWLMRAAGIAIQQENFESARDYLERLCPRPAKAAVPNDAIYCNNVGYAYVLQQSGEFERAARLLDLTLESLQVRPRLGPSGFDLADVQALALLGRPKEALARLREAIDAGWRSTWTNSPWMLGDDPYLTGLHDEPGFSVMVDEVDDAIARMRDRALQAEASGDWEGLLALAYSQPAP